MNQDRGVSPVISVILMLGLAVSIAAIASLTAFNLQNGVSTNPDITLQASDGDATATVVDPGNVDELKLDGVTVNTDVSAGDTLNLARVGSSASVIAVVDGQEQLVEQVETGASEPNTGPDNNVFSSLAGSGTSDDPYEISTDQELQAMNEDLDASYELTRNIDAGKSDQWNNGDGFTPIAPDTDPSDDDHDGLPFNGSLNGQGHTIAGLTIDRPNTNRVGLFGQTDSGSEITDVTVSTADVTGNNVVGVLVGDSNDGTVSSASVSGSVTGGVSTVGVLAGSYGGTVENTSVSGSLGSSVSGFEMGGLIGFLSSSGTVKNTSASVSVTGDPTNSANLGGLVGFKSGTVENVVATGSVSGQKDLGGLVGVNNGGTVKNAFASGSVTSPDGGSNVGGLVGEESGGTVSGSYWMDTDADDSASSEIGDTSISDNGVETGAESGGDFKLTQAKGDTAPNVMGNDFDFANTWKTVTGEFPQLQALND